VPAVNHVYKVQQRFWDPSSKTGGKNYLVFWSFVNDLEILWRIYLAKEAQRMQSVKGFWNSKASPFQNVRYFGP